MKSAIGALSGGLLFGFGLGLSGMTQPAKVLGFLDVFGRWDPTLLFVMLGATLVHFVLLRLIRRRERPLFATAFHLPTAQDVDRRLVSGAAIFGVGWGLAGFCPGPALVMLGSGAAKPLVLVGAMAIGMLLHHLVHAAKPRSDQNGSKQS